MNKKSRLMMGISMISLMMGIALVAAASTGALKLMSLSLFAQNDMKTEDLVNKVNRIGEMVSLHLNRGGSYINPDVEARGIQLCNLVGNPLRCDGYNPAQGDFCLSIPTRLSQGGNDVINMTGFRLVNNVLSQLDIRNINMAEFDHGRFCTQNPNWRDLHSPEDFQFQQVRFCRFHAGTPEQVTQDYETNCDTVIENTPASNMFWIGLFKATTPNSRNEHEYREARIIHLLNHTRVGVGT